MNNQEQTPTEGNKPGITTGEYKINYSDDRGYYVSNGKYIPACNLSCADEAQIIAEAFNLTQKHGPLHGLVERLERAEAALNYLQEKYDEEGANCSAEDKVNRVVTRMDAAFSVYKNRITERNNKIAELKSHNKELIELLQGYFDSEQKALNHAREYDLPIQLNKNHRRVKNILKATQK